MTDVRVLMYVKVEEGLAFYTIPNSDYMRYKDGNLHIRVGFKTEKGSLKVLNVPTANIGYPPYSLL